MERRGGEGGEERGKICGKEKRKMRRRGNLKKPKETTEDYHIHSYFHLYYLTKKNT